jgi:hypothetical protein
VAPRISIQKSPPPKTQKRRKSEKPKPQTLADLALVLSMGMPMDTRMAALYLGLSVGTLDIYRCRGTGPRCSFAATRPRYSKADLDAWLAAGKPKASVAS